MTSKSPTPPRTRLAHDSLLNELRQLERLSDCQFHVVVNARAQIGANHLQQILDRTVAIPDGRVSVALIRST